MWGDVSGVFFIDMQRAKVFSYRGAVTGPPFFSQPVPGLLADRSVTQFWLMFGCDPDPGVAFTGARLDCTTQLRVPPSRKWSEADFLQQLRGRRLAVASKTGRAAAVSAANGILRVLEAWGGASGPGHALSAGVLCSGETPDHTAGRTWSNVCVHPQVCSVSPTEPSSRLR